MTYHSGGHRRVGSTKQVGRREGRGGKDRGRERERERPGLGHKKKVQGDCISTFECHRVTARGRQENLCCKPALSH